MKVAVVLEQRFDRTPDGTVWATGSSYDFWRRYLDVFSGVTVIARVRPVHTEALSATPAGGPGVEFVSIPYYLGPWQYLRVAGRVVRAARSAVRQEAAVILRIASPIAISLAPELWRTGRPYGVEVVGDPEDTFARGVVDHPLRPLLRVWFRRYQRRLCARACGAAYVTAWTLQRKYPCGAMSVGISDAEIEMRSSLEVSGKLMTHYSSASLSEEDFHRRKGALKAGSRPFRILTVGSLSQLYKGTDVLIGALQFFRDHTPPIHLVVIGDGRYRASLEQMAVRLGVADRVAFRGALPPGAVIRHEMDNCDLFVLPSRTEGLPRAMVEAMARGLPCIGTTVGGIPELLTADDMVPPGDTRALARKIRAVVADPGALQRMSRRNFEKAREFEEGVLRARRIRFYEHVREATRVWLDRGQGA